MELLMIGYEGLDPETFVDRLKAHEVEILVDVREVPLSRKRGFSKNALAEFLAAGEIEYRHLMALGSPKSLRHAYREHGDWERYAEEYNRYLNTQGAALVELRDIAKEQRVCLLCVEADPDLCHRSIIVDQLRDLVVECIDAIDVSLESQASPGHRQPISVG